MTTPISDEELRKSLPESLNIHQGTVAMCSIFLGFVFSGLLQLLGVSGPLDEQQRWVVRALVVALLSLMGSVIGFHFVANQVIRYWNVFMPRSRLGVFASILLLSGLVAMLAAISKLLFLRSEEVLGWVVCLVCIAVVPFFLMTGTFHGHGPNTRDVGA